MSWTGFLFDTFIVAFLLSPRTRLGAYALHVVFHVLTRVLLPIGMFAVNARELLICIAHSCDSYTYTLYECDLDYTSCDPLPVQYTETNHEYEWGYLDINEATNEINAYSFKDSLIFTYGENPVCHIHRCEILGQ
jgi:hypothetical protein